VIKEAMQRVLRLEKKKKKKKEEGRVKEYY